MYTYINIYIPKSCINLYKSIGVRGKGFLPINLHEYRVKSGFARKGIMGEAEGESQSQRLRQLRFMMSPATRRKVQNQFRSAPKLIAKLYVRQ